MYAAIPTQPKNLPRNAQHVAVEFRVLVIDVSSLAVGVRRRRLSKYAKPCTLTPVTTRSTSPITDKPYRALEGSGEMEDPSNPLCGIRNAPKSGNEPETRVLSLVSIESSTRDDATNQFVRGIFLIHRVIISYTSGTG